MRRSCFLLKVKQELLEEYIDVHQRVWPELIDAMREHGIRNYSLHYRDDGLVVGYLETVDKADIFERLGQTDVSQRWEAEMAKYFEPVFPEQNAKDSLVWLKSYFYMP